MGERLAICQGEVEAAVALSFDEWDGARRLQLKLRDLRPFTAGAGPGAPAGAAQHA